MGVLSMRQRACSVGGFLNIKSELGQGTVLSLEMPVVSRSRETAGEVAGGQDH
jgi:hypothetical protein